MKKLCAVAFLGLIGLGLAAETASASWWGNWCCNRHGPKLHCRQYNAFSPYCCEPLPCGYNWDTPQGYADGHGYMGGAVVIEGHSPPALAQTPNPNARQANQPNAAPTAPPSASVPPYANPQPGPFGNQPPAIGQRPFYPGFQGGPNPNYYMPGYGWGNSPTGGR